MRFPRIWAVLHRWFPKRALKFSQVRCVCHSATPARGRLTHDRTRCPILHIRFSVSNLCCVEGKEAAGFRGGRSFEPSARRRTAASWSERSPIALGSMSESMRVRCRTLRNVANRITEPNVPFECPELKKAGQVSGEPLHADSSYPLVLEPPNAKT